MAQRRGSFRRAAALAGVAFSAMALAGCIGFGGGERPGPHPAAQGPLRGTMKPYKVNGRWYHPADQRDYDERGLASWYGDAFHGKPTATGERFDMNAVSAAHKTLPLPSLVEVTNLDNGRKLQIRVNDRGPFVDDRIIDLSRAAAAELGVLQSGLARVRVRYLGPAGAAAPSRPALQQASRRSDRGDYLVQVGSFADEDNAEAARDRLRGAGDVRIRKVKVDGRRLYRVLLGPWPDLNQAELARSRIAGWGFRDAVLVPAD